jgi:hypothetical protein
VLIGGLLVAGCDTKRFNTSPLGKSGVDVTLMAPEDVAPPDATPSADLAGSTTLGGPLAGLDAGLLARFVEGQADFKEIETVEDGLGPVFNEASCVSCHDAPIGGTTGRPETRFGRWDRGGFDPLARLGGSLLQDHAIGKVEGANGSYPYVAEIVPRRATVSATRITTPLFGLGLVDAVTDATLLELARMQARNSPATRGTPNLVTEVGTGATRVGRFGWKAQVASLHQFSGDAYLNEMGITSPDFPVENDPQGDRAALLYTRCRR